MSESNRTSVLIATTSPIVNKGLQSIVEQNGFDCVGSTSDYGEASTIITEQNPSIIILSFTTVEPVNRLVERVKDLKSKYNNLGVLVLSDMHNLSYRSNFNYIRKLTRAGVDGCLDSKATVEEASDAIRALSQRETYYYPKAKSGSYSNVQRRKITPREHEVCSLVINGLKNKEIASDLGIATGTVKIHLMHIFNKLGIEYRYQLLNVYSTYQANLRSPAV